MKKGFSLIELVFAIVIIGISVSVLPRIILQSQSSNEFTVKQELIFQAKSMMVRIMQGAWDSSHVLARCRIPNPACAVGTPDFISTDFFPVPIYDIPLNGGVANQRIGIVSAGVKNPNTILTGANATAKNQFNAISYGPDTRNDMDDYDGVNFTTATANDSGDFLFNTNVAIRVDYMNQNWLAGNHRNSQSVTITLGDGNVNNANPTNIKRVAVTTTDAETLGAGAHTVRLVGYFANIGQASFNTRGW